MLAQKKEQERKAEEAQAATEAPAAISQQVEESKQSSVSQNAVSTPAGGQENKVVECSILQVVPTEQKETQASGTGPSPARQVEQAPPQQVKLLVKDHTTSLEEAIRLIAPIFVLLPQAITMMGPNP